VTADGISLTVTGRTLAVIVTSLALLPQARRFDAWDVQQWLWETWRFVKMIFPLLVVGVFLVGVIRVFIQPEWIQAIAGTNTVLANMAGVVFGVSCISRPWSKCRSPRCSCRWACTRGR
jgi:uncharacterized membrane protein YraQ (UPF0718 family)